MVSRTPGTETALSKPSISTASRIDGRRLRSVRTKQLIIEAYLALATEKSPQVPTAAQIAEHIRATGRDISNRTVSFSLQSLKKRGLAKSADGKWALPKADSRRVRS